MNNCQDLLTGTCCVAVRHACTGIVCPCSIACLSIHEQTNRCILIQLWQISTRLTTRGAMSWAARHHSMSLDMFHMQVMTHSVFRKNLCAVQPAFFATVRQFPSGSSCKMAERASDAVGMTAHLHRWRSRAARAAARLSWWCTAPSCGAQAQPAE